ncbi:hypothetical protein [Blastopirellula marina]|uniref:SGNH/GDSL hydrolase family protein n=1 Tax=Blastopirellula marina TaxID=124 RepID=A0A2S8GU05_9BACT|nr:hypothetical protein [Blastopirellula marina]PQO47861.1 hypothetical protein C5Y93_02120 [Blastopirellula marina]
MKLNLRVFLAVALLAFAACLLGSLAIPHDPYIRYQRFGDTIFDHLIANYRRIHNDERPIDVVFLGSSRTGGAVDAELVSELLQEKQLDLNVENFSIPAAGWDQRIVQLQELLSKKKVKLVVFGVVERLPRDGHQAFADLATSADLLDAPLLVNRNLPKAWARMPYRQIELAMASVVPEAFGYTADITQEIKLSQELVLDDGNGPTPHPGEEGGESLEEESKRRKREIRPPILPDEYSFLEFGVSQYYLKQLQELSVQHNFKIAFVYFPFYEGYQSPGDLEYLEKFGPVWRATFYMHDPESYRDAAHTSKKPVKDIAKWVADKIEARLEDDEK